MKKQISIPEVFPTDRVTFFLDEVGRGAWAHDVVVAATFVPTYYAPRLIEAGAKDSKAFKDSKKSSAHQKRLEVAEAIKPYCSYEIGRASPQEIDEMNIYEATCLAMRRAIAALQEQIECRPALLVVDGKLKISAIRISQTLVEKGDARFVQIGAASVLAKVCRDSEMMALHERYPWYGWDSNKGYGGSDKNGWSNHLEGLRTHGSIPGIHRYSFGDISRFGIHQGAA